VKAGLTIRPHPATTSVDLAANSPITDEVRRPKRLPVEP
jgi:hypothetical protein